MKVFFVFPIIYLLGFFLVMLFFMMDIAADPEAFFDQEDPPVMFFLVIALMFPFHLFTIFCVFHNYIFTAKTLKSVELQKDAKFDDYAGDFFCVWFQIIGIWILQPRINKIYEGLSDPEKSNDVIDDLPGSNQEVI